MKFGLVIQGPLDSRGRTGTDAHVQFKDLPETSIVDFDCRENIARIVEEYGDLFEAIVLSTWAGELKKEDAWAGVDVVTSPDPGGVKNIQNSSVYKDNNKFRQFVSFQAGIEHLQLNTKVDYVVKLRTDQYLDLKLLLKEVKEKISQDQKSASKIFVPVTHPSTFLLHDLYFAGPINMMHDFCRSINVFDMFEFISSVHREMVLKHAYGAFKDRVAVPDCAYFPYSPVFGSHHSTRKIFSFMFTEVYETLSYDLFRTVTWRGGQASKQYVDRHFSMQEKQPRNFSLPLFITIDWQRYYSFRQEHFAETTTMLQAVKAKVSFVLWRSWMRFRWLVASLRALISD